MKTFLRYLFFLLLIAAIAEGVALAGRRARIRRLQRQLRVVQQETARLQRETEVLRARLKGRWPELQKKTVSLSNPLAWCIERIRRRAGLFRFDIDPMKPEPPVEMQIPREERNARSDLLPCLVPYKVRLSFPEISMEHLVYVLGQLEPEHDATIIDSLEITPIEGKKDMVKASATISFPVFYYPEDRREVREFLTAEER